MPDPDLTMREELHAAFSQWATAQNVNGQVTTFSVGFPAEFDDDSPLDPVPMYERPGAGLQRLLNNDAAARAGLPPDDEDELAGIRYAAARLEHLLDDRQGRARGWSQPPDAAEALGEAARLAELASALVEQADNLLGRELRAGREAPVPPAGGSGRMASPADIAGQVHDSAVAAVAGLGEAAVQLRRMRRRAGELQRTMRAAVAATADGPTLRAQYLVRCSPFGFPAAYHVRVFAPPLSRHVVIIGELADNHSTHLNNCIEAVARAVAEDLLNTRDADAVIWVQYGPAEEWYSEYDRDEDADVVRHDREDEMLALTFEAGFTTYNRRQKTSHDELERSAGGPVRRWHAYDYTIAGVIAAGARPVTIGAHRGSQGP